MSKNSLKIDLPSFDNVCYLISESFTSDEIGNEVATKTENMCFCSEAPAYSSEFFSAGQIGIKLQAVLIMDSENYFGEQKVKYNDVVYFVYRTFKRSDNTIELYLTLKAGD